MLNQSTTFDIREAESLCYDRFSRTIELNSRGRHNNNGGKIAPKRQLGSGNGNSSRFPGTRRSTTSELSRTSRIRQRFGSTVDFIIVSRGQVRPTNDFERTQLRNQCKRYAVVYVIEKALQNTCSDMNWCEVPLFFISTIFE